MTSEEYVESVNRLMEIQNNQTNIWLTWIGLFLGAMALLQWWYNSKESRNIKEKAKEEVINEINDKLGFSDLLELKYKLKNYDVSIISVTEGFSLLTDRMRSDDKFDVQHIKLIINTICMSAIKTETFFMTFFSYYPMLTYKGQIDYSEIFNRYLIQLPENYFVSDNEKVAIGFLIEIFEESAHNTEEKTVVTNADFSNMIFSLKSILDRQCNSEN